MAGPEECKGERTVDKTEMVDLGNLMTDEMHIGRLQTLLDELEAKNATLEAELATLREGEFTLSRILREEIAKLAAEKVRNKKLLWQIGEQAHASADQTELLNNAHTVLTALRKAVGEAVERQGHLVRNIDNYDRHDMANCIKEIAADLEKVRS